MECITELGVSMDGLRAGGPEDAVFVETSGTLERGEVLRAGLTCSSGLLVPLKDHMHRELGGNMFGATITEALEVPGLVAKAPTAEFGCGD